MCFRSFGPRTLTLAPDFFTKPPSAQSFSRFTPSARAILLAASNSTGLSWYVHR